MADPSGIVVDASACDPDDLAPCGGVTVVVPGEHPWDGLVDLAVTSGWPGLEALSGMPGTVAEVVRANPTAYGRSASDAVASVRTWDRAADAQRTFAHGDCRFASGRSRFQEVLEDGRERYDLLDVGFLFKQGDLTQPVRDGALARLLGVDVGERVPLEVVRNVLSGDGDASRAT